MYIGLMTRKIERRKQQRREMVMKRLNWMHTTEDPVFSTESRASSSFPLDTSNKQIKPSCN